MSALSIEALRQRDFQRLVVQNQVYVDYTGGGQCPATVLERYQQLLLTTVFGNPHSNNPTSAHTTQLIEAVRRQILEYFQAGDDYDIIFTSNASAAMKILGEAYPWDAHTAFILARDNHNSVMGTREFAKRNHATIRYWDLTAELRLQPNLNELLDEAVAKGARTTVVAFPAQSNFSGVLHPLDYVQQAKAHGATVWLDAAAFVPTHALNLQLVPADAVCLSFYKILGFPTGLGALLIRKTLLAQLRKPWFAGGTVRGVSLEEHVLEPGYERFEDGTINYAGIPALRYVFDYIAQLGGIKQIENHVTALTRSALEQLRTIPGVNVYGPTTMEQRGGTIALNITNPAGACISYAAIEQLAAARNISLRGGCFCNPGAGSKAFDLDNDTMHYLLNSLQVKTKTEANVPGAVRISFGLANNQADVDATIQFIRDIAQWQ